MVGIGKHRHLAGKKPLKLFLDKLRNSYIQIEFRFLIIGNSGFHFVAKEPVPEAYFIVMDN